MKKSNNGNRLKHAKKISMPKNPCVPKDIKKRKSLITSAVF